MNGPKRPAGARPGTSAGRIGTPTNLGSIPTDGDREGKDKVNQALVEEERHRLQDRLRLLEMDMKGFFDASQSEIRTNRDEIHRLRQENKDMKSSITSTRRVGGNLIESELRQLDGNIYHATLKLDKSKDQLAALLKTIVDQENVLKEIDTTSKPLVTDDCPTARKIRLLENRLDKSLIKYNEAVSIRRTYEQIVKRLKEEQVGFDNQLAAIERTLEAKAHDYQELLNMSHQANCAKESAKKELQDFQKAYAAERIAKDEELAKKKLYVQGKADQTFKLERKEKQLKQKEADAARQQLDEENQTHQQLESGPTRTPGESDADAERLAKHEAAFKTIRDATGVTDVNDLLQKHISQEETRRQLQDSVHHSQTRIDQLQSEIDDLTSKLEELRYSGSGQLGSRRIVEEFEVHLGETERQTAAHAERYESTVKLLISTKTGIEHLIGLLQSYKPDLVPPTVKDDSAVDALKVVEQKLVALADEVMPSRTGTDNDALVPAADRRHVELPAYNVRVHLPKGESDDEGDSMDVLDDPADDAVLKRDQVKKISVNAIQRETKKLKRRRK